MSFKAVEYLLFKKRNKELDSELLAEFSPFLTTKALSFYKDGLLVDYVNDTLNVYSNILKNKEDQFRFFENIIPIQPKKRIDYIKKEKVVVKDELPIPEFYSSREIDILNNQIKYQHE